MFFFPLAFSACSTETHPLDVPRFMHSHPDMQWELEAPQDQACTFLVRDDHPLAELRTVQLMVEEGDGIYAVLPAYRRTGVVVYNSLPTEAFTTSAPVGYDARSAFQVKWGEDDLDVYQCSATGGRWIYVGTASIWTSEALLLHGRRTEDLFNFLTRQQTPLRYTVEVDW